MLQNKSGFTPWPFRWPLVVRRTLWRCAGAPSGEVPRSDGAFKSPACWICIPPQIWSLSPEVLDCTFAVAWLYLFCWQQRCSSCVVCAGQVQASVSRHLAQLERHRGGRREAFDCSPGVQTWWVQDGQVCTYSWKNMTSNRSHIESTRGQLLSPCLHI